MEFWKEEGASSAEEWCAYRANCKEIEERNFKACCEKYPDLDPEDFPEDEFYDGVPTFSEWKAQQ